MRSPFRWIACTLFIWLAVVLPASRVHGQTAPQASPAAIQPAPAVGAQARNQSSPPSAASGVT